MSIITPSQMSKYILKTMRDCVAEQFPEWPEEERELKTAELLNLVADWIWGK